MARSSAATRCLAPIPDLPPTVIQTDGVEPNAGINEFDKAIAEFATAYGDQTERDGMGQAARPGTGRGNRMRV
jgi:hypothetical protein